MADKKESTFLNMTLTLLFITGIAAGLLGSVYEFTKLPIELSKTLKKTNAINSVLPEFDNQPLKEVKKLPVDGDTLYFYPCRKSKKLVGVAVETYTNKGFGGTVKLIVGFLPNGTINNISVLSHSETPGLGNKMEKKNSFDQKTGKSWSDQFNGKDPTSFVLKVKKDGGDVDAITAATISSRAFCDAVQKAVSEFQLVKF